PGAGLLGEQPALQPVGQARDDAVEMLQLLVEQAAQPGQFLRVGQLVGADLLVELGGEGLVGAAIVRVRGRGALRRGVGVFLLVAVAAFGLAHCDLDLGALVAFAVALGRAHLAGLLLALAALVLGLRFLLVVLVFLGLAVAGLLVLDLGTDIERELGEQ